MRPRFLNQRRDGVPPGDRPDRLHAELPRRLQVGEHGLVDAPDVRVGDGRVLQEPLCHALHSHGERLNGPRRLCRALAPVQPAGLVGEGHEAVEHALEVLRGRHLVACKVGPKIFGLACL